MDETTFWGLIESAKVAAPNDFNAEIEQLTSALAARPAQDIVDFAKLLDKCMARSYTWDLWGAAFVINGGCSDDGFDYFRAWLIAQGRKVFENALRDPETLIDIADPEVDGEPMLNVAHKAHESKTGKELPVFATVVPRDPSGESWDEDSVNEKYPILASKFP